MSKTFVFLIIGLFFGTGFGFLLAATTGAKLEGHDHSTAHDHNAHDHGTSGAHDSLTEVGAPVPTLTLMLHEDGAQSRNLHIATTNFTFAPEAVNGTHVPGQGHAHIYVNDIKIARTYGPWFHLSALPKGEHVIRVTLNANDHPQLAHDGQPIEASIEVTIE